MGEKTIELPKPDIKETPVKVEIKVSGPAEVISNDPNVVIVRRE